MLIGKHIVALDDIELSVIRASLYSAVRECEAAIEAGDKGCAEFLKEAKMMIPEIEQIIEDEGI